MQLNKDAQLLMRSRHLMRSRYLPMIKQCQSFIGNLLTATIVIKNIPIIEKIKLNISSCKLMYDFRLYMIKDLL